MQQFSLSEQVTIVRTSNLDNTPHSCSLDEGQTLKVLAVVRRHHSTIEKEAKAAARQNSFRLTIDDEAATAISQHVMITTSIFFGLH